MRVAVFISPHGFGHAARASAVMSGLLRVADCRFEIFTTVPRVFFEGRLGGSFGYHPIQTDVGFRQQSALELDLPGTQVALREFKKGMEESVERAGRTVADLECALTLSDISPLGILVGRRLGIPTVLVENFTWDWIYGPLAGEAPQLEEYGRWLSGIYALAEHRFQASPVCLPLEGCVRTNPVAREPQRSRDEVRGELGIAPESHVILVTMGGAPQEIPSLEMLGGGDAHLLVTGAEEETRRRNLHFFSRHKPVYSPDLISASDLVVAKLGYSTVAEVWLQDRPLYFVANDAFREAQILRGFVKEEMVAREISGPDFESGAWTGWSMESPSAGLRVESSFPERVSGGKQIASSLLELIS